MRIGSQVISAIMGGITVFYLYYASQAPYPDLARWLLIDALNMAG